jgi:hypothetical protein
LRRQGGYRVVIIEPPSTFSDPSSGEPRKIKTVEIIDYKRASASDGRKRHR